MVFVHRLLFLSLYAVILCFDTGFAINILFVLFQFGNHLTEYDSKSWFLYLKFLIFLAHVSVCVCVCVFACPQMPFPKGSINFDDNLWSVIVTFLGCTHLCSLK